MTQGSQPLQQGRRHSTPGPVIPGSLCTRTASQLEVPGLRLFQSLARYGPSTPRSLVAVDQAGPGKPGAWDWRASVLHYQNLRWALGAASVAGKTENNRGPSASSSAALSSSTAFRLRKFPALNLSSHCKPSEHFRCKGGGRDSSPFSARSRVRPRSMQKGNSQEGNFYHSLSITVYHTWDPSQGLPTEHNPHRASTQLRPVHVVCPISSTQEVPA